MCDGVGGLTPPPAPVSRRSALFKLGVALNALAALLLGVPLVGYVASAVRRRGQQAWVSLGPASNFPERQTRLASYTNPFTVPWDGKVADIPCWVRRLDGERFQVFAINCTHLGCPVRWFQESGLFMCPCHGGVFYQDGRHASGPPPRPLYQYEHRIRDGKLEVRGGQIPHPLGARLMRVGDWFEERLQLKKVLGPTMAHPVPRRAASWWYVFGSATLVCFMLQIATGICLALVYVPSTADVYASLEYLNYQQTLGWFLRAVHFWGSNFMVAMMSLHMIQVFLFGAYKYPRELTWIVGVFLLLCTLGMAFTGQVLRWDQDAYWGLGIGVAMIGRAPLIGAPLVHLVIGGPIIGGETLSRFFALHGFVIPGLLFALIGVHLLLVLKLGINEWPMPGRLVDRATYRERYEAKVRRDGVPFFPVAAQKDLVFGGLVILAILLCAAMLGPYGPNGPADPTLIRTVPRPDFYFLSLFALFALLPPYTETFLILVGPVVAIAVLLALPFLSGTGEKSFRRRPVAVISVIVIVLVLGILSYLGAKSPWSPVMDAWSGAPVPIDYVKGRSPVQLQGALVFQNKQCRNCHSLGDSGGRRGPALDGIASRMTRDLLIRQVLQGGGNMPAYGKNLSPSEVTALVAFLDTLRSPHDAAARSPVSPPPAGR